VSDRKIVARYEAKGRTVKVEFEENGIAWVILNRPEKRNAMSPTLNHDMLEVLEALEFDNRCKILVLTGAGDAWTAGMDLREFFREVDKESPEQQNRVRRSSEAWQWRKLRNYPKPTIAMVNGWCFGGAFTPLCSCDLAIAADDALFGVSEVNWGIIPGGVVTKALQVMMNHRDALWYIMTGETFTGKDAARMGVVNKSVPLKDLEAETRKLCETLLAKGPAVLYQAKVAFNYIATMDWDMAGEWLRGRSAQLRMTDKEGIRNRAMTSFLDKKEFRPGLGAFNRDGE
jgi:trans-feruloyl-CoA hydratase/vanillin synthase